jgi:ribosome recycling factor
MAYDFKSLNTKIKETEAWLSKELSGIRTGRAAPAILDSVKVDSYGSQVNITSLASINVEDPRTLRISPWDMSQAKNIEKAIGMSNLGVSVSLDEKGIRVSFPELTTERRTSLMKVVKERAEEARVSLRLERDRVWKDIQQQTKEGKMSEDDRNRLKNEMEKIIKQGNTKIDELTAKKEKEILS